MLATIARMDRRAPLITLAGLGLAALLAATPARAGEPPAWPVLPKDAPILIVPKGATAVAKGMTTKAGAPGPQQAAATLSWNDGGLTVIVDCEDTAVAAEWAKDRDSDKTWKDDSVAVLLDLGHKHVAGPNFLSFKLSAAGALQDCRGVARDISYNVEGCTGTVKRGGTGWQGTIFIPWKGLGVTPAEGEIWGVNITRLDHPGKYEGMGKASFMAWAPFDQDFESLAHFGHLVFAASGAKTDDAAVSALREQVRTQHVAAEAAILPHAGHELAVTAQTPALADGFVRVPSGAAPGQATTVAATWGEQGLDLVFTCADGAIIGAQQGRDNVKLWKDDSVYVWLDLGHQHAQARDHIMVQVSVNGEVFDTRSGDPKFDVAGLVAECARTDAGWRAHLVLPWQGLGVAMPKPGEAWGVNFQRMDQPGKVDFQAMQSSSWIPLPEGDPAAVDRWGHLLFLAGDADLPAAREAVKKSHEARTAAIRAKSP